MEHVVDHPAPSFRSTSGKLEVHQIPAWRDNFIWAIVMGKQLWAVDGPELAPLDEFARAKGLGIAGILNTHTHPDHVGINHDLEDAGRLEAIDVWGPAKVAAQIPGLTRGLKDGDAIELGGVEGQVLQTEGHIDGHISFVFEDLLFCGDTLFAGGCGYLFDGPPEKMYASLVRLAALPGHTKVCCAHEYTQDNLRFAWTLEPDNPDLRDRIRDVWQKRARGESTVPSTIELELATNPFLRTRSQEIVETLWQHGMPKGADPAEVFAAARKLKDSKAYESVTDDDLPL